MGAFDAHARRSSGTNENVALPRTGVGGLSRDECVAFLASSRLGRIAVSIGALPVILPINYLAIDGAVWFRTPSEGSLFHATVGSVVAFEADGFDDIGLFSWSVLVRGVANEISDPRRLEAVKSRFADAWPLAEHADRYVVVPATMLTGQWYARVA